MEQADPNTNDDREPIPLLFQRMRQWGVRALNDKELLALLLCGAMPEAMAWRLASALHDTAGGLHGLARLTLETLKLDHHLTERQAFVLHAAQELARRKRDEPPVDRPLVSTSAHAYALLRPVMLDLPHEEFWLLLLDRGNRVIRMERNSVGGLHGTVADPKTIFKAALDHRASSLVVAHNHPSGQLRPSEEDIRLTRKLVDGARLLDISVQDHVIIGDQGYYSFADNGQM